MSDSTTQMELDPPEITEPKESPSMVPPAEAPAEVPARPTPRKLPTFLIDLHMPMVVYFPEDDDKIIRSLREYEYGGPLPPQPKATSVEAPSASTGAAKSTKKEIPLPGVSIRPEYDEEVKADFQIPATSLIQYSPPVCFENDIHFERFRIEYEYDDEDDAWRAASGLSEQQLDEEAMEILIDVLEKESFRQLEFRQIQAQIGENEDVTHDVEDVPCSACGERDFDDDNPILYCDGCDIPVHRHCQDLEHVPDGDWFCDVCLYRLSVGNAKRKAQGVNGATVTSSPSSKGAKSARQIRLLIDTTIPVVCELCGMVEGGPFKKTQKPGKLVHVVCALMTPEVWFEKDYANISKAQLARKTQQCAVCHIPGGVVKCAIRGCNMCCHVMCARENGQTLLFNVPDPSEENSETSSVLNNSTTNGSGTVTPSGKGLDDSFVTIDGDEDFSVDSATLLMETSASLSSSAGAEKKKKKKKKTAAKKKIIPHLPFQMLCPMHSGSIRAAKLEEARKESLNIPVEVGRFLTEEANDESHDSVDTTTFAKAVSIIQKTHSKRLMLSKPVFDRVVEFWREKRLRAKLGHMPFIFQLHVLVSHFKQDFDAGRKLEGRPRQVEVTLAQYTPQQKYNILRELRDGVESLRTLMDLIKKREVKKRQAIVQRLELFDSIFNMESPKKGLAICFPKPPSRSSATSSATAPQIAPVFSFIVPGFNSAAAAAAAAATTATTATTTATYSVTTIASEGSSVSLNNSTIPTRRSSVNSQSVGLPPPKKKRMEVVNAPGAQPPPQTQALEVQQNITLQADSAAPNGHPIASVPNAISLQQLQNQEEESTTMNQSSSSLPTPATTAEEIPSEAADFTFPGRTGNIPAAGSFSELLPAPGSTVTFFLANDDSAMDLDAPLAQ